MQRLFSSEPLESRRLMALSTPFYGSATQVSNASLTSVYSLFYDRGGEGVAYHDSQTAPVSSQGQSLRGTTPPDDIGVMRDTQSRIGYAVGNVTGGDWEGYSIHNNTAGQIAIKPSVKGVGTFHLEFGPAGNVGTNLVLSTPEFTATDATAYNQPPAAGGAAYYTLPAGDMWMRVVGDSGTLAFDRVDFGPAIVPFGGTTPTIAASGTTTIEAEKYDTGGLNYAYYDTTAAKATAYRNNVADDIGIFSSSRASNGLGLSGAAAGEWQGYSINVAQAGVYDIGISSAYKTGQVALQFGPVGQVGGSGTTQTLTVTLPATAGSTTFATTYLRGVTLPAGTQWMRVLHLNGGGTYDHRIDDFTFTRQATPAAPYGGTPVDVGGSTATTIEAERYDTGGQGTGYSDTANGGSSVLRGDNVGIIADANASGGYAVGSNAASEWQGFSTNVTKAGVYDIVAYVKGNGTGGSFHVEFGPTGQYTTGISTAVSTPTYTVPPSAGSNGQYVPITIQAESLSAGKQWFRLVDDSGGYTIDKIVVQPVVRYGGGSGQNMLLIVNPNEETSMRVAQAYQQLRHIPDKNVMFIVPPTTENFSTLNSSYITPILNYLQTNGLADQIDYIGMFGQSTIASNLSMSYQISQLWAEQQTGGLITSPENPLYQGLESAYYGGGTKTYQGNASAIHSTTDYTASIAGVKPTSTRWFMADNIALTNSMGILPDEEIANLTRSAAADGSKPGGTVYFNDYGDTSAYGTPQYDWSADRAAYWTPSVTGADNVQDLLAARGVSTANQLIGTWTYPAGPVRGLEGGGNGKPGGTPTFVPGAFAANFGSFTGQPGMQLIRQGATMASGTVIEPYAINARFVDATIQVQVADGATLGSAWYHSIRQPDLQVPEGDMLSQAWADVPQLTWNSGPADGATVGGSISINGSAALVNPTHATGILATQLYIDGNLSGAVMSGNGTFNVDTTALSDGRHELRLVAYNNSPAESAGYSIRNITVNNNGESVTTSGGISIAPGTAGTVAVSSSAGNNANGAVSRIELRMMGRSVGSVTGGAGNISLDPTLLAYGDNVLTPLAVFADGTQVTAAPITVTRVKPFIAGTAVTAQQLPGLKAEFFLGKAGTTVTSTAAAGVYDGTPDAVVTQGAAWSIGSLTASDMTNVAIRLSGKFTVDPTAGGEYQFFAYESSSNSVEAAQIYVDGKLLQNSDNAIGTGPDQSAESIFLSPGEHTIQVLIAKRDNKAVIPYFHMTYRGPNTQGSQPASSSFFYNDSPAAANLPAGWSDNDTNAPSYAGNAVYDNGTGTWTLTAGGADINTKADQQNFASTVLNGDGSVIAKLGSVTSVATSPKSGVMIRDIVTGNMVELMVNPGKSTQFVYNILGQNNNILKTVRTVSGTPLPWLKLTRTGDTYTAYTSADGVTWTQFSTVTVTGVSTNTRAGIGYTNNDDTTISTATFSNVSVIGTAVAPTVVTNPISQTVTAGNHVVLTAAANGTPAPAVQWYVMAAGGSSFSAIDGATSTTLDLGPATAAMSGNQYQAVFTNTAGSVTTTAATLSVAPTLTASQINDGAVQRSGVASVTVTFSQPVTFQPGAFTLTRRGGGSIAVTATQIGTTSSYLLQFAPAAMAGGSLTDGLYDLTVHAQLVQAGGIALAGGDQTISFHRLFGDLDGNGVVDGVNDYNIFRTYQYAPATPSNYAWFADFDGNGIVNPVDSLMFRRQVGKTIS